MIGSGLSRFDLDRQYLLWDTEAESLSLGFSRPWELSYACATIRDGIQWTKQAFIRYPDRRIAVSEDAARITRFRYEDYDRVAIPAAEVWGDFSQYLLSPEYHSVGHHLLGYDVHMVSTLRAALGLPPDHSWTLRTYDTNALAKAYQRQWAPDTSSPEAFLAYQYRCLSVHERGFKSNLGFMCRLLGIPYDETRAHGAAYDIEVNWSVFRELAFKLDF